MTWASEYRERLISGSLDHEQYANGHRDLTLLDRQEARQIARELIADAQARIAESVAPEPSGWRRDAACRGIPTSLFYPHRGEAATLAYAICALCPVQSDCEDEGRREKFGIWGGHSERWRRAHRRPMTHAERYPVPDHGTPQRYRGGSAWDPCRCAGCIVANSRARGGGGATGKRHSAWNAGKTGLP